MFPGRTGHSFANPILRGGAFDSGTFDEEGGGGAGEAAGVDGGAGALIFDEESAAETVAGAGGIEFIGGIGGDVGDGAVGVDISAVISPGDDGEFGGVEVALGLFVGVGVVLTEDEDVGATEDGFVPFPLFRLDEAVVEAPAEPALGGDADEGVGTEVVDEVGGDFAGEGAEVDDGSGEPGLGDVVDGEGVGEGKAVLDLGFKRLVVVTTDRFATTKSLRRFLISAELMVCSFVKRLD